MKKEEERECGFLIYRFMVEELSLSGTQLLIYALIYSFARSGHRFFGTQEYIAKRIGCTVSTVRRSLGMLLDAKLITKVFQNDYKTPIYTIIEQSEKKKNNECGGYNSTVDFNTPDRSFSADDALIFGDKNKEIINTTSTTSSKSAWAQKEVPKIFFSKYGTEGMVTMTEGQYDALCNAIGDEMTEIYIGRLETYLISNPSVCLKSHYKTILKWAAEDSAV